MGDSIIRYTLANTEVARNLRTAADAWATFANSERGQTFLATSGKPLSDLLDAAGIAQSKIFSDLRVEEADRIAADTAANFSLDTLAAEEQAALDTAAAAADTAAATNTDADLPRTEIPAEDSLTGQPITVDPLETADYDPTADPATGQPTAAYIKGRQEAEHTLAAKAEADAAAAAEAAAAAKAKAEKSLPGQTKWATPAKKSKPLSDSETKQTLISVAGKTVSTDGLRPVLSLVTIQRKKGTEYTVSTDARHLTVLSRSTTAPDTESDTEEFYDAKGVQYKRGDQPYPNWRQTIPLVSKHQASTTIDLSYYSFLAKGSVKGGYTKRIDSPFFRDGRHLFFNIGNHRAAINPVFMRDIYKQMQQLGKKLGFPPTLKAYYFEEKVPLLFTAEHNGITYQSIVMPQRDHALDENGNKLREGGTYIYKTPDITPGDIILGEQPSIYGEQDTGSFSIFSPSERSGLSALRKLTTTGKEAKFRSDTLNQNVMLLPGSAGKLKNPENPESKIVGAYGFIHMIAGRMAHGEDLNEATYTAVKAIMAAVNGKIEEETSSENKKEITLDGYNTWVYLKWKKEDKAWVVTGYKANDKHTSADDKRRAMNLAGSYALETFGGLQQVGAALDYAIARLAREYKQNNADPKRKPSTSQQETSVSTLSLRRPIERNYASILRERDATLLRVSNYIKRHARRTTRVIGADTDKKRAGVAFAQANAIIAALDKYIFARELINRNTAEYRRLTSLRSLLESFVTTAQKGKLPSRRNTKAGDLTTAQETRIAIEQMIDATLAERSAAAMPEEGTPTAEQLVTTLAADQAEQVIATMLDLMGDIIETHIRNSILERMATSLRSLRPRHTAAGRVVRNIIDADTRTPTLHRTYCSTPCAKSPNIWSFLLEPKKYRE